MQEQKLTIAQLAEKVNDELKNKTSSDARYSSELSERRIRDYISKGILDKPFGQGRDKWFGQQHVDKLLAVRNLQSDGISDQSLKKLSSSMSGSAYISSENIQAESLSDNDLQKDALGFLSHIGASSSLAGSTPKALFASASNASSQALATYYTSTEDTAKVQALNTVQKQVSKIWNE